MNIIVVGQGAIGLMLYAKLSRNLPSASQQVSLLPSKVTKFPYDSFNFTSLLGDRCKVPITLSTQVELATADLIIVCVKAYQLKSALHSLQPVPVDTPIILCHNGKVVLEEIVNNIHKTNPILLLLTTHGSKKQDQTSITHTGAGQSDIGVLTGELTSTQQAVIFEHLKAALTKLTWQKDITKKQWTKLAINCVINPITALNDIDNGKVNDHQYHQLKCALVNEVVAVAKKEGVVLSEEELLMTVTNVAKSTATNCSSMRSDILKRQTTEIEFINGYVAKRGKFHRIATPENTRMWQSIKILAKQS